MNIYSYSDYRRFIRDEIESLRKENPKLSIREILRRVGCSSPSYYKEVIIDGRKNMSVPVARRFSDFLKLSGNEAEYFLLLVQYNQAKTELERLSFYEKLLNFRKRTASEDYFLKVNEYGYMMDWCNMVVRELLPLAGDFGNRSEAERNALVQLLRVKLSEKQIDDSIRLLEALNFIKKNSRGNYRKTDATIRAENKSPAAFQTLCQFTELGNRVINTTDPQYRMFKVAVTAMSGKSYKIIEKKISDLCREIVEIASSADGAETDRLYAINIQFFPLTKLPEEKS